MTHLHSTPLKFEDSIASFNKGNDRCCIGSRCHYHSCSTNEQWLAMCLPYIRILYYNKDIGQNPKNLFWEAILNRRSVKNIRDVCWFDISFLSGSFERKFSYKFPVYCCQGDGIINRKFCNMQSEYCIWIQIAHLSICRSIRSWICNAVFQ